MASITVVGGGIIGASAAYNLAKNGDQVTVIDPDFNGAATMAAAGIIHALIDNPPNDEWFDYAFPAMRYYPTLAVELEELGERDHSYRQLGELTLSSAEDPVDDLNQKLVSRQVVIDKYGMEGIGTNCLVEGADLRELCPLLKGTDVALWHSGAGNVDGRRFRAALLRAVDKLGGRRVRGSARLRFDNQRVVGVELNGTSIDSEIVVLAAGAWTTQLLRETGHKLDVYPQRGQITHVHLPGAGRIPAIVGINGHYILSFDGDRVVFGATREDHAGFDDHVTVGGIEENIAEACQLMPDLKDAALLETRVGFRPFTPNRIPHIGWSKTIDGLLIGAGSSSQGLTIGAYTGKVLADLAAGGTGHHIPPSFAPRV